MPRKVSMQLIADRLGLSKFTVSQSLSGRPGVNEETRAKVIAMAKALGYKAASAKANLTQGPMAQGLMSQASTAQAPEAESQEMKPSFVLIWIPSHVQYDPYFWQRVIAGIINGCREHGWDHMIANLPSNESKEAVFPYYVDRASCIGILVVGSLPSEVILSIKKMGLPVILVDHEELMADVDCVVNANIDAAKNITQRVVSLGSSSIIFVGNDSYSISFKERWIGCRMAMEDYDGDSGALRLSKWSLPYSDESWQPYLKQTIMAMDKKELPDCFICANDHIALGLLSILQNNGMNVPERCKVVGFDNIAVSAYASPPLTTVELAKEELGYRAVEALHRRIGKPGSRSEKITLPFRIIIRQTD